MNTGTIILLVLLALCIIVIVWQTIASNRKNSIWTLLCVMILGVFAVLAVVLLTFQPDINDKNYQMGVRKGLDSNVSMKYTLITDSLYKKK